MIDDHEEGGAYLYKIQGAPVMLGQKTFLGIAIQHNVFIFKAAAFIFSKEEYTLS
ncbi:MAG: hypothetical protein V1721_09680 [Pseudomonadota bacterium]